jgi:hypothetical protein
LIRNEIALIIVIAEDDETSLTILESALKKSGYEVMAVTYGVEAGRPYWPSRDKSCKMR